MVFVVSLQIFDNFRVIYITRKDLGSFLEGILDFISIIYTLFFINESQMIETSRELIYELIEIVGE